MSVHVRPRFACLPLLSVPLLALPLLLAAACGSSDTPDGVAGSAATSGNGGSSSPSGGSGGSSAATGGSGQGGASGTSAQGGGSGTSENGGTSAGTGGTSGTSGTSGGNGTESAFTASVTTSSAIPTVGIVTFTVDASIDSAVIDFGRDETNYEYQAPVDLTQPMYRTLLLGMKPDTQYYARITATGGGKTYVSQAYPVMTGFLPNGLPKLTVTDHDATKLYAGGGFTVNCTGLTTGGVPGGGAGGATESFAFIFDKDGEAVWAYELTETAVAGCSRARLSPDGKYVWAGNFNNADSMGAVMRVGIDGLDAPKTIDITARNHDFAFLPNGHLLYWEQQNGGGYSDMDGNPCAGGIGMQSSDCTEGPDIIREMDPDTLAVTDIYDETRDFASLFATKGSHTNQVNYVPSLDAISFSMRHSSTIGLISYPDAKLLAIFGGELSQFDAMDWEIQHGHEVHADHLWVFNNNGANGGSAVLGFDFDLTAKTATSTLTYESGVTSGAFGDVKELPNGNLFVTYSTAGVFHEITGTGTLLREMKTNGSLGYSEHRSTLYGKAPPFADAAAQ